MSGTGRLILLYDFLSWGKGGETAHFLPPVYRLPELRACWCSDSTGTNLICFTLVSVIITDPCCSGKSENAALLNQVLCC